LRECKGEVAEERIAENKGMFERVPKFSILVFKNSKSKKLVW
jgi:hypothetical protein